MARERTLLVKTASALLLLVLPATVSAGPDPQSTPRTIDGFGVLPLAFEANRGQVDESVHFVLRRRGSALFLTSTGSVMVLHSSMSETARHRDGLVSAGDDGGGTVTALRMHLVGANPTPELAGGDALPGTVNYLTGKEPDTWHTRIPRFGSVTYEEVYPGVDLVYYSRAGEVAYDFIVGPDADPGAIELAFEGADSIELDGGGNLVLGAGDERVVVGSPRLFQERASGARDEVSGRFVLREDRHVSFEIGTYDPSRPLIIDPTLDHSTYLGGTFQEAGGGIAVDGDGAVYITGETRSLVLPPLPPPTPLDAVVPGVQPSPGGDLDGFVIKLSPDGTALEYATYLGGSHMDRGNDIAVDADGSAYVVGSTNSVDFPVTAGAYDVLCGADGACDGDPRKEDAFVVKLAPDGTALSWSSFLGGQGKDNGRGIAVDGSKSAYVTGYTEALDFPVAGGFQTARAGAADAFFTRFAPDGASVDYSTYVGGGAYDIARRVAVDDTGRAWLTGYTNSWNFPTVEPCRARGGGASEAFVTGIDPTAVGPTSLISSTMLGGSEQDNAWTIHSGAIAVGPGGVLYVTGSTRSTDFPLANAYQDTHGGERADVFVSLIDPAQGPEGCLIYSSYLGGSDVEVGTGIAVDDDGTAYITGYTLSGDFPVRDALQSELLVTDAFVTHIDPSLGGDDSLVSSTYLGGSQHENGMAVAMSPEGHVIVMGETGSDDFPTEGAIQPYRAGSNDLFLSKIAPNEAPVADAGPDIALACSWLDPLLIPVATAALDGSASSDPDGDPIEYTWTGDFPEGEGMVTGVKPTITASLGSNSVTLVVDDGLAESEPDTLTVTVTCSWPERIGLIQGEVDTLVSVGALTAGQGSALVGKLDAAIRHLSRGRVWPAIQKLRDFVEQVDALVRSESLTEEQGQRLRTAASDVISEIGPDA